MRKITLWLSAMVLVFYLVCTSEPTMCTDLKFKQDQIVNLRVGGSGQIIAVDNRNEDKPYRVRIRTEDGIETIWMNEFELESRLWRLNP